MIKTREMDFSCETRELFSLIFLFFKNKRNLCFLFLSCLARFLLLFSCSQQENFSPPKGSPSNSKEVFSPFDYDAVTITSSSSTITALTMTSNDKNLRLAYVLPLTQYSMNNFTSSKQNVSNRNFKIVIIPFCLRQGSTNQYQTKIIPSKKAQQYSTIDQHHKLNRI